MYTEYSPPAPAAPVSPLPPVCYSTVAAAPVTEPRQKEIRVRRERSSRIFFVLVPLLVAVMLLNGVFSMPDGSFSRDAAITLLITAGIAAVLLVIATLPKGKNYTVVLYDEARINEAYNEGVVSTGAGGRLVIAYDEVTALVETPGWLALFGKETEIVWSAEDLTAAEYQTLMQLFAAKLPQTVLQREHPLQPRKLYATPITAPAFSPVLETIPAAWSTKAAAENTIYGILDKAAAWFWLLSGVLSCALCAAFDEFAAFSPIAIRLIVTCGFVTLAAAIMVIVVTKEQHDRTAAANKRGVRLHVLADGLRIDDGPNFYSIPADKAEWTLCKDGSRVLAFGERGLRVSFYDVSQSRTAGQLFK